MMDPCDEAMAGRSRIVSASVRMSVSRVRFSYDVRRADTCTLRLDWRLPRILAWPSFDSYLYQLAVGAVYSFFQRLAALPGCPAEGEGDGAFIAARFFETARNHLGLFGRRVEQGDE